MHMFFFFTDPEASTNRCSIGGQIIRGSSDKNDNNTNSYSIVMGACPMKYDARMLWLETSQLVASKRYLTALGSNLTHTTHAA